MNAKTRWISFGLALFLLTACAAPSVKHLKKTPWKAGTNQSVSMQFWRFDYETVAVHDKLGVKGMAYARLENLPAWVDYVEELTLYAYLTDAEGHIVDMDEKQYLPRENPGQNGVPFDFFLKNNKTTPDETYITFGYHSMFSSRAQKAQAGIDPQQYEFFASETAVTRY
ncbi:hypothetical protein [Desulfovibrio inopinatus]|uniref:hypothetical protein n=1 Tax=Desulfovibrio inopinatus TaxID=102109 RepID=UPI00040AB95D|nr:hypothetical protein [Desulfovibrio inopinatus]